MLRTVTRTNWTWTKYLFGGKHMGLRSYRKTVEEAEKAFTRLVKAYPDLLDLPQARLTPYLDFMTDNGFRSRQAAEMALLLPDLLKTHQDVIPTSIVTWRNLGYELEEITETLSRKPELVILKPEKVLNRFSYLLGYFTKHECLCVIANSIEVMFEPRSFLNAKLEYLVKDLSHRQFLIATSPTLSFDLNHIKSRHEFLIRAGLFIPVPYNQLQKKSYTIQPRLGRPNYFPPGDIVCTDDADFLKFCGDDVLSLNELAAFEESYNMELKADEDLDSDEENNYSSEEEDEEEIISGPVSQNPDLVNALDFSRNSTSFFNEKDSSDFYY